VRYRSSRVFSLGRWTARFPTMLACIVVLRILPCDSHMCTGLSPSMVDLPRSFYFCYSSIPESYNPSRRSHWFGLFRFRSPLLAESSLFLALLRCFSSGGSLPFYRMTRFEPCRVSPFGHLRLLRFYTPHRSFSQCNTSFFGTRCLGIHYAPFVTFRNL
jgi:hypothetical protein